MKRFEIIDHTADAGIAAYGSDIKEAFANAAYGMFSLIAELDDVKEDVCREVTVEAIDREALLVNWLNELLYLSDVERVIFCRFDIKELEQNRLEATAYGEKLDTSRHLLKTEVKAATYHALKIENDNGCRIKVIVDL